MNSMVYIIVIVGFIVLSLGSFIYVGIMREKSKNDILNGKNYSKKQGINPDNEKNNAIELSHPIASEFQDVIGFGVLMINGGMFSGPSRTLQMNADPKDVKKYDLEKYWNITDKDSAIATLESLKRMQSDDDVDMEKIFSHDVREFFENYDKLSPEEKVSKETQQELGEYMQFLPQSVLAEFWGSAVGFMDISYTDIVNIQDVRAWDIERLAGTARKCYFVGYISKEECLEYLTWAKETAKIYYHNWQEYALSVLLGRAICYNATDLYTAEAQGLLEYPTSVWNETAYIWKN